MTIDIQNIKIDVVKKDIKNLHLYVLPPDGKVRLSAPLSVKDENIEIFVRSKISWIKQQQEKFAVQLRQSERQFVSGETLYVWGKPYYLQVKYSNKGNDFLIDGDKIILTVRKESTAKQRENYVNEVLREKLKAEIERRLPEWEKKIGLFCARWETKYMNTHWGSFSEKTQTITFNLQLVKKQFECLDYIIVHELGHIQYRKHNKDFIKYMDIYFPYWRETKKLLNDSILDYLY